MRNRLIIATILVTMLATSLMAFIPGRPRPGGSSPSPRSTPVVIGIPPLPSISLIPIPN